MRRLGRGVLDVRPARAMGQGTWDALPACRPGQTGPAGLSLEWQPGPRPSLLSSSSSLWPRPPRCRLRAPHLHSPPAGDTRAYSPPRWPWAEPLPGRRPLPLGRELAGARPARWPCSRGQQLEPCQVHYGLDEDGVITHVGILGLHLGDGAEKRAAARDVHVADRPLERG